MRGERRERPTTQLRERRLGVLPYLPQWRDLGSGRPRPRRRSNPIVITGVAPNPKGSDVQPQRGEFVVMQNVSEIAVDIGGWHLQDKRSNVLVIPLGTTIQPRSRIFLHTGPGIASGDHVFCHRRRAIWNSQGDVVWLRDASGMLQQTFRYGNEARLNRSTQTEPGDAVSGAQRAHREEWVRGAEAALVVRGPRASDESIP
jgi:hypothetical protein